MSSSYLNDLDLAEAKKNVMLKVFGWMTYGLLLTAVTAFLGNMFFKSILETKPVMVTLLILMIVFVFVFGSSVLKQSKAKLKFFFSAYAIVIGLVFESVFAYCGIAIIGEAFAITTGMFIIMVIYGLVTKKDLTTMGSLLIMALWGIIIASLVNFFLWSGVVDLIITYVTIIVFVGLIAYDAQKIKGIVDSNNMKDEKQIEVEAIALAFELYLDFINLFLRVVRLLGKK